MLYLQAQCKGVQPSLSPQLGSTWHFCMRYSTIALLPYLSKKTNLNVYIKDIQYSSSENRLTCKHDGVVCAHYCPFGLDQLDTFQLNAWQVFYRCINWHRHRIIMTVIYIQVRHILATASPVYRGHSIFVSAVRVSILFQKKYCCWEEPFTGRCTCGEGKRV